jgi:hypothetical protein
LTNPGSSLPPASVQRGNSLQAPTRSPALAFLAIVDAQNFAPPTLYENESGFLTVAQRHLDAR